MVCAADWVDVDHTRRPRILLPVKKQKFHTRRTSGIQAEIYATVTDCGAQRKTPADGCNRILDHDVLSSGKCPAAGTTVRSSNTLMSIPNAIASTPFSMWNALQHPDS
jgi:hypothetical protein